MSTKNAKAKSKVKPLVGVVAGSKSDEACVKKCLDVLDQFGVSHEYHVFSAHRTPKRAAKFSKEAAARGNKVIIAVAGLAAALPGVVAAHTNLPVIGVPVDTGPLNGVDALYSIAQMPPGVPVATVGIGNSRNAAHLAVRMLAVTDKRLQKKLQDFVKSHGDL